MDWNKLMNTVAEVESLGGAIHIDQHRVYIHFGFKQGGDNCELIAVKDGVDKAQAVKIACQLFFAEYQLQKQST